jgi:hypothetical protein
MAIRKMTSTVSPPRATQLTERNPDLIRACELANQDPNVAEIEKEFDGILNELTEPWN